jgi:hypothetical protein
MDWDPLSSHPAAKVNDALTAPRLVKRRSERCRLLTQVRPDPLIKRSQHEPLEESVWSLGRRGRSSADGDGSRRVAVNAAVMVRRSATASLSAKDWLSDTPLSSVACVSARRLMGCSDRRCEPYPGWSRYVDTAKSTTPVGRLDQVRMQLRDVFHASVPPLDDCVSLVHFIKKLVGPSGEPT